MDQTPPLDIVVFCAGNQVTAKAVSAALYMARPGRDTVHLVHVVLFDAHVPAGQVLLAEFTLQAQRSMIAVQPQVLVSGGG